MKETTISLPSTLLSFSYVKILFINHHIRISADTTISRRKCTNPSDLVSQATKSPVSTVVGDHTGILGVVFFPFFSNFKIQYQSHIHIYTLAAKWSDSVEDKGFPKKFKWQLLPGFNLGPPFGGKGKEFCTRF
jgi:hypothetical protein